MPAFQVRVVNDKFESLVDQNEKDLAAATASALKGAIATGTEAILAGQAVFGAEVTVRNADERNRFVVMIAISPIL